MEAPQSIAAPTLSPRRSVETPYGNHLDLDFVQYAEDVASGAYKQHLRQLRRVRKQARQSMEGLRPAARPTLPNGGDRGSYYENNGSVDSPVPNDRSGAFSPMESIFSDSLENVMSDFEEAYESRRRERDVDAGRPRPYLPHQPDYPSGYGSDYGYAVPSTRRGREASSFVSSQPAFPGVLNRPSTLNSASRLPGTQPYDLSPTRRLREKDRGSGGRAVGVGLSDSLTSLSSIGSSSTPLPYRGLSGQIARNMDSLASRLGTRPETRRAPKEEATLTAVRAQMDLSLSHMAELESQVQYIPALNTRISSLKADRDVLSAELARAKLELDAKRVPPTPPPKLNRIPLDRQLLHQPPPQPRSQSTSNISALEDSGYSSALARAFRHKPQAMPTAPAPPPRSDSVGRVFSPTPTQQQQQQRAPAVKPKPPPRDKKFNTLPSRGSAPTNPTAGESPFIRTPRGSLVNLAAFNSVRRSPSQSEVGASQPGTLRRGAPDDYASDSEIALGENRFGRHGRSESQSSLGDMGTGADALERFTSLRRSRRLLSQSAAAASAFHRDSAASDTEEAYASHRRMRNASTSSTSSQLFVPRRLTDSQLSIDGDQPGAFATEIRRWRQEFGGTLGTFGSAQRLDSPEGSGFHQAPQTKLTVERAREFITKNVLTRAAATSTLPPRDTNSVGVNANIEPPVKKTETKVDMRSGLCQNCEGKKKTSIGMNTAPLPAPKPAKECPDCPFLRMQVADLEAAKPIRLTKETATHCQSARIPSRGTMTDLETASTASTADIPEPRPPTADAACGAAERSVHNIATETPQPDLLSRHSNTDAKLFTHAGTHIGHPERYKLDWLKDATAGTDSLYFYASISVGTNNDPFNPELADTELGTFAVTTAAPVAEAATVQARAAPTHSSAEVADAQVSTDELDLDSILLQLNILQNATDLPKKKGKRSLGSSASVGVATEEVRRKTFGTNTPTRRLSDSADNTESAVVSAAAASASKATATDGATVRSVHAGTEQVELREKGVGGPWIRTREAGTMPSGTLPMALLPSTQPFADAPRPPLTSNKSSATDLPAIVKIEQATGECQVDLPPSEDEILDWVVEYQQQTGETEALKREAETVEEEASTVPDKDDEESEVGSAAVANVLGDEADGEAGDGAAREIRETNPPPPSDSSSESHSSSPSRSEDLPAEPEPDYDSEELPTPVTIPRPKPDIRKPRPTRAFELSKAAAAKKLLTSDAKHKANLFGSRHLGAPNSTAFARGAQGSSSVRLPRKNKGDNLAFITDKKAQAKPASPTKAPAKGSGLRTKVDLKGSVPRTPIPPIPKRKENPKRKSLIEEEALLAEEGGDRLTPLPSDLVRPYVPPTEGYVNTVALDGVSPETSGGASLVGAVEPLPNSRPWSSGSGSESDSVDSMEEGSFEPPNARLSGTCELSTSTASTIAGDEDWEISAPLSDALAILDAHLGGAPEAQPTPEKLTWAQQYASHEWLKCGARKTTNPHHVEAFIDVLESMSKAVLVRVVNIADHNENTALHYAVSHGNFDVVSLLLDSKVCNLNRANAAGYTPVMLAALCPTPDDTALMVVQRLFQMGDVNIKASQHGQTALMLAVSHGKEATSQLLLESGAGVNIQDEDGSTALMCAAEHGHKHIVKLLLGTPEVDASLADADGATALSIAVENGHRDIGVLIYAHLNYNHSPSSSATASQAPAPNKTIST